MHLYTTPSASIAVLRADCLAWIDMIRHPELPGAFKYNRHMVRPYATEATAHVVMILDLLGALEDSPHRAGIIDFLLAQQDPSDGLFKDALISDDDRARWDSGEVCFSHSWAHIWNHHTGVCEFALPLLGVAPRYPLPAEAQVDLDAVDPYAWTLSLDWSLPYLVSAQWIFAVNAYRRKHGLRKGEGDTPALTATFAALEEKIFDPASGFPERFLAEKGSGGGMGGAYILSQGYVDCGRPYPHPDAAVRSVIGLQQPEGWFTTDGGMCMNMDAMITIDHATDGLRRTSLAAEARQAGQRLAEVLLMRFRKPDGGLSFLPDSCLPVHNSIRISEWLPESDVLGTAYGLRALSIIDRWLSEA
jgi:hypothetical protein